MAAFLDVARSNTVVHHVLMCDAENRPHLKQRGSDLDHRTAFYAPQQVTDLMFIKLKTLNQM